MHPQAKKGQEQRFPYIPGTKLGDKYDPKKHNGIVFKLNLKGNAS